jgi:hypothetical protein
MTASHTTTPSVPPRVRAAIDAWVAEVVPTLPRLTASQRARIRVLFGIDREETRTTIASEDLNT